jgi:hypothetical protein
MKNLSKYTKTRLIWHNGKKQRAHRVIMSKYLGRDLLSSEDVHHINHDPLDNRLENLIVIDKKAHCIMHSKEKQKYPDYKNCIVCGSAFKTNPRKRKRQKCCSKECAQKIRVTAALRARGDSSAGGVSDI